MHLLCKIHHRVDHPMHEYLYHFVATHNTRASAAVDALALVLPRFRTDQFSRLFLSACCRRGCIMVEP